MYVLHLYFPISVYYWVDTNHNYVFMVGKKLHFITLKIIMTKYLFQKRVLHVSDTPIKFQSTLFLQLNI